MTHIAKSSAIVVRRQTQPFLLLIAADLAQAATLVKQTLSDALSAAWRIAWEEVPECFLKSGAYERFKAFSEVREDLAVYDSYSVIPFFRDKIFSVRVGEVNNIVMAPATVYSARRRPLVCGSLEPAKGVKRVHSEALPVFLK